MTEFFEFLGNHYVLSTAFFVVLILFIINELKQRGGAGKINPQQAIALMNHEDAIMIDVRHSESFREGHVVNSQNIPSKDLEDKLSSLERYKQKAIIFIDDQGLQASKAAGQLKKAGFEQVYYVSGGMISWKSESLPLTKKD